MSDEQVQTIEETVNAFYPAEESEPLKVPTEEAAKDEEPVEDKVKSDTEEAVEEENQEADDTDEEGDILVYEINDKEYTAKDIEKLEAKGKELQAGYTKKYQSLAEDVKSLDSAINKTNDLSAQLEVLVGEDDEINWTELKEDDPDRYIELKERADNRKSKLEEVKANNKTSNTPKVDTEAERVKLIEANPQWLEDEKPTQAYKDDMEGLHKFYQDGEWTQDQVNIINGNAKLAQLVLESVRSKTTESKKASTKKKIIATPKSGKIKAQTNNLSAEEIFYPKK